MEKDMTSEWLSYIIWEWNRIAWYYDWEEISSEEAYALDKQLADTPLSLDLLLFIENIKAQIFNSPRNIVWYVLDWIRELDGGNRKKSYEQDLFQVLSNFDEFSKNFPDQELLKKLKNYEWMNQESLYLDLTDDGVKFWDIKITYEQWKYITVFLPSNRQEKII